ncbi:hypothetical protein WR25_23258 [Diploscapter pachys]|uniref:Uncharacterized protein n=1 Tax=Diploscapter pachys TaxID=2018661 RepID=A0A2A2K295_9BILA|nr:hypothetical protein WR25_23258 [Diploscapter pachys]
MTLHEVGDAVFAAFAAVARLLEAAERRADRAAPAVDRDEAGAQARRDLGRFRRIAGDRRRQAIFRGIGQAHGLVAVRVARDRRDWAERFLARDAHVGRHVGEDGRADIIAGVATIGTTRAAGDERRAFVDRRLDQRLDLVELRLVDDRADMRAHLGRIAHGHGFEDRLGDLRRFLRLAVVDEQAGGRDAALPRIGEHTL